MGIQYLFPFVVQQDVGVLKTLQRTALVALDNVIVSFLLTLAGAVFLVVCLIPWCRWSCCTWDSPRRCTTLRSERFSRSTTIRRRGLLSERT